MTTVKLTNEELWQKWKDTNDITLRNELITKNMGLVYSIILGQRSYLQSILVDVEDIAQEVFLSMPQFLNNYNPITGYKLSTYLSRCVYLWAIKRVKMDQLVKVPVNNTKTSRNIGRFMYDIDDLDQNNMPIYRNDPLDQLITQENVEQLRQAIAKLSPRNQTLLRQVMDDNTFSAVGRQLGITRERVRQIYSRSLQVIKETLTNGNGD